MERQHILLEYDNYVKKYKKKYGVNTVVLIQLGSFYELCSVIDDISYGESNIHYICDNILNMAVAKKKYKDKGEYKDYYQGGFPIVSYDKYIPLLLNSNYTIVFVDQITEKPEIKREVTNILSPGTNIKHRDNSNYLLSIYIELYKRDNKEYYIVGVSAIDLSTGINYIHYINNTESKYWSDEISRLINFYNPSEMIFQTENYKLTEDMIMNQWDINNATIRINHYTETYYKSISYQKEYLEQVFDLKLMISILDYFHLTHKKELSNSYIYLLEYINEHQPDILKNINEPIEYVSNNYLVLNSNSIRQLNIVNNYSFYRGKNESLLEICNKTVTSMGARCLKNRLLYPSLCIKTIQNRYQLIERFIKDKYYNTIRDHLKYISDIEKTLRLMSINKLSSLDLYSAYLSYEFVIKTFDCILNNSIEDIIDKNIYNKFLVFFKLIESTFDFDNITNLSNKNIVKSIFKTGYDSKLDDISIQNNKNIELIENIINRFSTIMEGTGNNDRQLIKYIQDKDGNLCMFLTNTRCNKFKQKLKNMGNIKIHIRNKDNKIINSIDIIDINFKRKDGANMMIDIPIIKTISEELIVLQKDLNIRTNILYTQFIDDNYKKYKEILKQVNDYISNIDFLTTGAKISIDNNYCKPNIYEDESFIDVKNIRHPIVEKINHETEYITNDICIGKNKTGILLYGTNACGKSTLMKSIGLNIVLAQAGLYVAASEFNYSIYTQIFTRILNNDNIFKSQSSFAIEMEELRTIEQRSDNKSLVLGDELCSGTETISALSIVSAGLHILSKKNVSFIITTHLHQLTDIDIIKNIENLNIYHLKIININGKIFYDRKISSGSGPSVYGLNVCEAMGVSKEFIDIAYGVQKKLQNNSKKISRYNQDIVMDKCKICKETAEETHHIKEQNMADENGIIEHFHKNNKHNLVPLCKKCHDSITYGTLVISGYTQTSEGIELNYHTAKTPKSKKKFNDEDVLIIKTYKKYYDINISDCRKRLKLNNNISISLPILNKIMNDKY